MAAKLVDSEDIGSSFSSSMNGLLASVSMARIAIEGRDKIIADLQAKLASRNKDISDLQTKLASQDKSNCDLLVKNENLTSYLALLNQTLEFLISKDFPVNSSKFKALNQNFQVDCVICNEQRLVLWKLLPVTPKETSPPSDELLVRVMKHFAGKGTPSFGSVTARVDSIDVGAEANSELGKRRRESEAEDGSSSTAKVTGITTDNRTIVPSASVAAPKAKSPTTTSSVTSGNNSATKYSISAITAADKATSSAFPTAPVVSIAVTTTAVPAISVTWPNKPSTVPSTAASSAAGSSVRALPLPVSIKTTTTATAATAAPIQPPNATVKPYVQATAKPVVALTKNTTSIDVLGPAGPLSRLDTAAAVSSVFNLQSGTKEMAQWLRESQPPAPKTASNPVVSSATGTSTTTTTTMSAAEEVPPHKKRKSSVQPLPLSDLLRVASASKAPTVLDLTTNPGKTNAASATASAAAIVPVPTVPTVPVNAGKGTNATQSTSAPTVPALPLTQSAKETTTKTKNGHESSSTKGPMSQTTTSSNASAIFCAKKSSAQGQSDPSIHNIQPVITSAADTSTTTSTSNNHAIPTVDSETAVDPTIGTISPLPSNKPAQSWHTSADGNLRPLIIKSMIMKHKDYKMHKHEPAWVASRRKGCEIFEAMQYYNCRTRLEYLTQTGVNVC
eukprot:gene19064-21684_t